METKTGKFISIHIADIHIGSTELNDIKNQIDKVFLKFIKQNLDKIDMIVIHGDYFDTKISLNDHYSVYGIKLMNQLCTISNKNNIQLRIIKGTKTHDFNQLDNFLVFENKYKNFKIINHVEEEELYGLKFLYVPEEYINDQNEYYKEFKNKKYDYILGHGTWDVAAFQSQIEESERNIKSAPIFMYNEWENAVNQKIIFGHIHTHSNYKKLIYPGSFTRWIYGEEKDKGFIYNEYNYENNTSSIKFVKNKLASKFDTIKMSKFIKENYNLNDIIKYINELPKENHYRLDFSNTNISLDDINVIKEVISKIDGIKISNIPSLVQEFIEETTINENEFDFLNSNDMILNIQEFIKNKYNQFIKTDDIKKIVLEK